MAGIYCDLAYRFYVPSPYFCSMPKPPQTGSVSRKVPYPALCLLALLLLTAERLWFLTERGIHLDEAYTFIEFTYEGIWRSMSYYPVPNNHVFLTVITAVFYKFTGSPFWSLRLPALLIGLAATVYIFLRVFRYTTFWVAFTGVGLFCLSYHALFYSLHARGYFLLTAFSAMAAFSVFDFLETRQRRSLLPFVLATCLGFYTVPVFLYPFLSIAFFGGITLLVRRQTKALAELAATSVLAGLLTVLLYLPVFWVSGLNAVIGNEFVVPASFGAYFRNFIPWFRELGNALTGREPEGFLLTLAMVVAQLLAVLFSLKKYGRAAFSDRSFLLGFLLLSLLLVPFAVLTLQRVLPPSRVFLYLGLYQFLALAWLLDIGLKRFRIAHFFPAVAMVLLPGYSLHQARVLHQFPANQLYLYHQFETLVKTVERTHPKRIFAQGGNGIFFTQNATVSGVKPEIQIDHQTFDGAVPYDYILLKTRDPLRKNLQPNAYREIYRDEFLVLYQRQ